MTKSFLVMAAVFAFSLNSNGQSADFPQGAEPISADALRDALSGKVFSVAPVKGPTWRWQFDGNGYFFLNIGSFQNSGKWSTRESSVCQDTGKSTGCNEMRMKDSVLYLKRDSGEVVSFQPQK